MLTCPSARSPSAAQRWSVQTRVKQTRAGQGRIPPDFPLAPPLPPPLGAQLHLPLRSGPGGPQTLSGLPAPHASA